MLIAMLIMCLSVYVVRADMADDLALLQGQLVTLASMPEEKIEGLSSEESGEVKLVAQNGEPFTVEVKLLKYATMLNSARETDRTATEIPVPQVKEKILDMWVKAIRAYDSLLGENKKWDDDKRQKLQSKLMELVEKWSMQELFELIHANNYVGADTEFQRVVLQTLPKKLAALVVEQGARAFKDVPKEFGFGESTEKGYMAALFAAYPQLVKAFAQMVNMIPMSDVEKIPDVGSDMFLRPAFNKNGTRLAFYSREKKQVLIFAFLNKTWQKIHEMPVESPVARLSLSPDGTRLLLSSGAVYEVDPKDIRSWTYRYAIETKKDEGIVVFAWNGEGDICTVCSFKADPKTILSKTCHFRRFKFTKDGAKPIYDGSEELSAAVDGLASDGQKQLPIFNGQGDAFLFMTQDQNDKTKYTIEKYELSGTSTVQLMKKSSLQGPNTIFHMAWDPARADIIMTDFSHERLLQPWQLKRDTWEPFEINEFTYGSDFLMKNTMKWLKNLAWETTPFLRTVYLIGQSLFLQRWLVNINQEFIPTVRELLVLTTLEALKESKDNKAQEGLAELKGAQAFTDLVKTYSGRVQDVIASRYAIGTPSTGEIKEQKAKAVGS